MDNKVVTLFVPGRISIIGEISDFVCDYKKYNDDIICGSAIASSIDEGIYAVAKKSDNFIFKYDKDIFKCKMNNKELEKESISDSFYSYVCGVALYINQCYDVNGIDIEIKYNQLKIKKGLASSAAISVLVAKAFNLIYELDLEPYEIMKIAYEGEHIAKSMCGRLNQICAKGIHLSKINFEKECLDIESINVKEDLNFVIVDLNGMKNTKNILSKLHSCLPFPKTDKERALFKFLCRDNNYIVEKAKCYIEKGDKISLGQLLLETQELVDEVTSFLGEDFKLPRLHKLLYDENIQKNIYGAKSIGYGGDGAVELLAKDETSQKRLDEYITNKLGLTTYICNIKCTHKVKNAVIYLSNCNNFEDIFNTCKKLDEIGIEKIYLIIDEKKVHVYNNILNNIINYEDFNFLSSEKKIEKVKNQRIYQKIEYITCDRNSSMESIVLRIKEATKQSPVIFLKQQICKNKYNFDLEDIIKEYDKVGFPYIYNENYTSLNDKYIKYDNDSLNNLYLAMRFIIDSSIYDKIDNFSDNSNLDICDSYSTISNIISDYNYDFYEDESVSFNCLSSIIEDPIYNFENNNIDGISKKYI